MLARIGTPLLTFRLTADFPNCDEIALGSRRWRREGGRLNYKEESTKPLQELICDLTLGPASAESSPLTKLAERVDSINAGGASLKHDADLRSRNSSLGQGCLQRSRGTDAKTRPPHPQAVTWGDECRQTPCTVHCTRSRIGLVRPRSRRVSLLSLDDGVNLASSCRAVSLGRVMIVFRHHRGPG